MQELVKKYVNYFLHERSVRRRTIGALLVLAMAVTVGVFWEMKNVGIAVTNEVHCGLEEHTHTDECYESVLTCGYEQDGNHTHADECYTKVLTCTSKEHTHSVDCLLEDADASAAEESTEITVTAGIAGVLATETADTANGANEESSDSAADAASETDSAADGTEITADDAEDTNSFTLQAQTEDGIVVTISGDEPALPYPADKITVTVEQVEETDTLAELRDQALEEEGLQSVTDIMLDITLWYGEEEIEPTGSVTMEVSGLTFTGDSKEGEEAEELDLEGTELKVYHLDEEALEATDMEASTDEDGTVVVDTDHFSIYVFTYTTDGDGTITINEVTSTSVGITEISGKAVQLSSNITTSSQITITADTILDLNGYTLEYTGAGDFITVSSGTLTIMDSGAASETVEAVDTSNGTNLYGNLAEVTYDTLTATSTAYSTNKVFFDPSTQSWWLDSNAIFTAYFTYNSSTTSVVLTLNDEGYYECEIPDGYSSGTVYFERGNGTDTWNTSSSLSVSGGTLYYVSDTTLYAGTYPSTTSYDTASLTYYVTESTVNSDGISTTETLYKHTLTATENQHGSIIASVGGTSSIVYVSSSSAGLTIEGGLLAVSRGSTGRIVCNYGTFTMNGGYLCGGDVASASDSGGAVYNTGTFNLTGGVIAANKAHKGGGVYSNGTVNMSGGIISGNTASGSTTYYDGGGAGVYSSSGTLNLSGGYVTNNKFDTYSGNDGAGDQGGGGIATKSGTFTMSGGYVTGNYSEQAGGGLYVGYYNNGTTFTMTGGTVASNEVNQSEGGGIRIAWGTTASIIANTGNKIYITNNIMNSTFDWGGGGIFVQQNGSLTVYDSLITSNTAGGFGGGVAACPTGTMLITNVDGTAIYSNMASGNSASSGGNGKTDDYDTAFNSSYYRYDSDFASSGCAQDYYCVDADGSSVITLVLGVMLGDGAANWSGRIDGNSITISKSGYATAQYLCGLTASPSDADEEAAIAAASVIITGNSSTNHGGGIMTNGSLTLGNTETSEVSVSTGFELEGIKSLVDSGNTSTTLDITANQFTFLLLSAEPSLGTDGTWTYDNGDVIGTAYVDSSGNFTLDTDVEYDVAGTYTYYMIEKIESDNSSGGATIAYDTTVYKITVVVSRNEETVLGVTMINYTVNSISVESKDAASTSSNYSTFTVATTTNSDGTYTLTFSNDSNNYQATFTNTKTTYYELPSTGRMGTAPYHAAGLLLACGALTLILIRKKRFS